MSDLWVINGSTLQSGTVVTTGELPTARVGHAALLIGNAFIGKLASRIKVLSGQAND